MDERTVRNHVQQTHETMCTSVQKYAGKLRNLNINPTLHRMQVIESHYGGILHNLQEIERHLEHIEAECTRLNVDEGDDGGINAVSVRVRAVENPPQPQSSNTTTRNRFVQQRVRLFSADSPGNLLTQSFNEKVDEFHRMEQACSKGGSRPQAPSIKPPIHQKPPPSTNAGSLRYQRLCSETIL